jgi:hypothetical protein
MKKHAKISPFVLLSTVIIWSCSKESSSPVSPEETISLSKRVKVVYEVDCEEGDAGSQDNTVVSTAPGTTGDNHLHTTWSGAAINGIAITLADGSILNHRATMGFPSENGKGKRIVSFKLWINDEYQGIAHTTGEIPLEPSNYVLPDPNGFTVHAHAINVPLYRLKKSGGKLKPENIVGSISFGDIVFTPQL